MRKRRSRNIDLEIKVTDKPNQYTGIRFYAFRLALYFLRCISPKSHRYLPKTIRFHRVGALAFGNARHLIFRVFLKPAFLVGFAFLFLPIDSILAQVQSTPPNDASEVSTSPPEDQSKTDEAENLSLTNTEKSSTARLDPRGTAPEKETVIGDGDKMFMSDNFVQIHGNALIKSEDVVLYADHIWADFDDNIMRASGNVRLIVGNEETFADELIFDLETKKGIARDGFTFDDPWYFGGSEIFKIEDDESYIRGGRLTTCSLKHPHFYFSAYKIIVKINKELS